MDITRLGHCLEEDYPSMDWDRHAAMADLWLEIDDRFKASQPIAELLQQIEYRLSLSRRWPQVDCISMGTGLAVSLRVKAAFESLGVPGLRFLEFRVNGEPFFQFYTDHLVDCLDRQRSEIKYFQHSPGRVMHVVRYAFVEERLRPCDLFTVPELSDGIFFWSQETFVTEIARATIESGELVGLRFEQLPEPATEAA